MLNPNEMIPVNCRSNIDLDCPRILSENQRDKKRVARQIVSSRSGIVQGQHRHMNSVRKPTRDAVEKEFVQHAVFVCHSNKQTTVNRFKEIGYGLRDIPIVQIVKVVGYVPEFIAQGFFACGISFFAWLVHDVDDMQFALGKRQNFTKHLQ